MTMMAGRSPVAFARRFWEKGDKRRPDEGCPWLAHVKANAAVSEAVGDVNRGACLMTYEYPII
jgi:hypothetical protein